MIDKVVTDAGAATHETWINFSAMPVVETENYEKVRGYLLRVTDYHVGKKYGAVFEGPENRTLKVDSVGHALEIDAEQCLIFPSDYGHKKLPFEMYLSRDEGEGIINLLKNYNDAHKKENSE